MRLITKWVLFHCVLLLNFQNLAFSQTVTTSIQKHPLPLLANISISPDRLAPGENAQLKFNLSLEKKYKAYSDQFKIEILNPANVKIGKLKVSPEFEFMDSHSKKKRKGFSEKAQLSTVIELSPDTSQGPQELKVKLTFQTCTKKICHLPQSMILMTQLEVVPPQDRFSATPTSSPRTSHSSPSNNIEAYLKKGFALTLLFVFLAGILTSLTPCIFPMIPITLAILGTQQQEEHPQRFRGFTLSFTYVLGIATTYSVLGLIAASTGSVFGSLLGHPIAVTAIASVFILMGLSMYGFFELQVPRFISDRLGTVKTKKSSYSGAFISGTIAGIVASPCVGPVLVGILTYAS